MNCLPKKIGAAWFACQCFDVKTMDLNEAMQRLRKSDQAAEDHFPAAVHGETIARAKAGSGPWSDSLLALCHRSLYDRIRFHQGKPLFSFTAGFTERLVFDLLRLYERVAPQLKTEGLPPAETMWVLVEHLFLPTVFIELMHAWQRGLGSEFEGSRCWYLSDGKRGKPIPKLLDCWLRVTGYRTAHGVSRRMGDAEGVWRRRIDKWLSGKPAPTLAKLHGLVDKFAKDIRWLDTPEDWKARFTLACAIQNLGDELDEFFKSVKPDSSLWLAEGIRAIEKEGIVTDDERLLGRTNTFFAARLFQRRLKHEKRWKSEVATRVPSKTRKTFPADAPDEEINQYHAQLSQHLNPGNWLLDVMKEENDHRNGKIIGMESSSLEEQIISLGIVELNRILDLKRAGGRKARRL